MVTPRYTGQQHLADGDPTRFRCVPLEHNRILNSLFSLRFLLVLWCGLVIQITLVTVVRCLYIYAAVGQTCDLLIHILYSASFNARPELYIVWKVCQFQSHRLCLLCVEVEQPDDTLPCRAVAFIFRCPSQRCSFAMCSVFSLFSSVFTNNNRNYIHMRRFYRKYK